MSDWLERAGATGLGRNLRSSAAVFLVASMASLAVPQIAAAQNYSFSSVRIEGNERIEPQTILSYAGIARGKSVSAGGLNDAYQRLQGSGLFESVEIVPQGGTLVIKVQEYPTISVVNFEGNKKLKDEQLATLVASQSRKVYSPATVEADAAKIVQAYAEAGRLAARVDPKVIRRDGNRVDIAFEIKEGKVTEIERISFTGNRAYSDRRLRNVLATKQAGLLRQIIQRDTFVEGRVDYDRQLLTDFYRSRGYVDVQVTGVSSEMTRARDAFFMTFNIREGQQFRFGKITTVSEVAELDAAEFQKQVKIRSGVIYSPNAVDLAITRMEELALRAGAQFVRVDPRVTRNERDGTLDVEFALVRGPRVFVERIDIEGNTTTLDQVIRRQFNAVEGDPFNPREIRNSAERIRALGFFAKADVNSRQGSGPDQVVVDVNVEEQPTGSFAIGASYGKSAGFGLTLSLQESNFLGRGQYLGLSVGTTADNKQNSITFVEPFLLGRDLRFKFRTWYNTSTNDNADFSTKEIGISPALEFPVARNARLELRYTLSQDEMFDVNANSSPILQREAGKLTRSALGYTYTYDSRNTGLDPRWGVTLRFGQDVAGFGGDVEAITTTALARVERKVLQEEVTLRAELEGGAVHARGDSETTAMSRFAGGSAIRGFESNGYGPRDLGAVNQDALGGKYFAALRLESEFPLGLPEEYGIHGGLFFDVGSVWGLDDVAGATGTVDDDLYWRSSVGFSLFWTTPIGPLRFNFSKALMKEDYDQEQPFDLTISTKF
ncbi:MAG: outer membrane protein assembly factor BamA [Sphingomonadales bacterium]|nr:outer membrane protein assembly factor BamA [Sphingomonadales bacterium]